MGAKTSGKNISTGPTIEPGMYQAICIWAIELGTQKREWQGTEKLVPQILLGFELEETFKDEEGKDRRFVRSIKLTNSLGEKANLRKLLVSWRGVEFTPEELECFELSRILGKHCMVTLSQKTSKAGKTYITIESINPLPKGMPKMEGPENEIIDFGIEDASGPLMEKLPEWVQNVIKESEEYRIQQEENAHWAKEDPEAEQAEDDDNQIPF